jgi:hypothetical protein
MASDVALSAYVAELIMAFGVSPQQRFSLGTAFICESAMEGNAILGEESPFKDVVFDHSNPFKTAAHCLLALVEYVERKEAERAAAPEAAPDGTPEADPPATVQVEL